MAGFRGDGGRRTAEASSPWHVPPMGAEQDLEDAPVVESDELVVPAAPQVWAPVPDGAPTPRVALPPGGRHIFAWVGAHGGAGTTSLARGSGTGADLTRSWPAPALGWPRAAALVCRSNNAGLDAAARLIQEVVSGVVDDVDLAALVVVADAPGKPPKPIRTRIHELAGTVPQLLQVPWIESWREYPYTVQASVQTVATQIVTFTKENS